MTTELPSAELVQALGGASELLANNALGNCRGSGHRAAPSMESWPSRPVLKMNCVPFATWSFSSRLVVPSFFTARQQGRERVFSR